jgi:hypothetical protein
MTWQRDSRKRNAPSLYRSSVVTKSVSRYVSISGSNDVTGAKDKMASTTLLSTSIEDESDEDEDDSAVAAEAAVAWKWKKN